MKPKIVAALCLYGAVPVCMATMTIVACSDQDTGPVLVTTPSEPRLLAMGAYLINRTPSDSILQTVPSVVGTGCTTFTGTLRAGIGDSVLLVRSYVVPPQNGGAGSVIDASPGRVRAIAVNQIVLTFRDRVDTALVDNGVSPRTAIALKEHFPSSPGCGPAGFYIVNYLFRP